MAKVVEVDESRVKIALGKYQLSLGQRWDLMRQIGAAQLVSVRRTFRDEGVPAHSWMPLAPSTIARNPKLYGAGHKLLVLSGRLLNSITFRTLPSLVIIGTNLKYAAVHFFGSRDRGSIGIGPRTEEMSKATVGVREHRYMRQGARLGYGKLAGHRRNIAGPRNASQVVVSAHRRHQNIPARPYLVFRPEDPGRIRALVEKFTRDAKQKAGLGGGAQ